MPITLNGTTGITTPTYNGSVTAEYLVPVTGFKNRIINGDMQIDQRNAGAAVTLNNAFLYTLDRWSADEQTDGAFTVQQSSVAPAGFTNSLLVTTTTADSSLGASQYAYLLQAIEGFNCADLGFGTANASTVTLSFWVRSSLTGTFGGAIRNYGANRAYPFTYTINSANTWEQKAITIAGDTTGTWLTNNSGGLVLAFGLGVGSSFSATAGSWTAGNILSATGATNVLGTLNATWQVTGVQLEKGSNATSFDYRPYTTELQLCQRYLPAFRATSTGDEAFSGGGFANSTVYATTVKFPVTTRVPPTGMVSSSAGTFAVWWTTTASSFSSISFAGRASTEGCQVNGTINSGSGSAGQYGQFGFYNSSSAFIYFTGCEL